MTASTVYAVCRDGKFEPVAPTDLPEGQVVQLEVTPLASVPGAAGGPEALAESVRRIRAARSIDEWVEAANAAGELDPDDGYDFLRALDENRRRSGAVRLLWN